MKSRETRLHLLYVQSSAVSLGVQRHFILFIPGPERHVPWVPNYGGFWKEAAFVWSRSDQITSVVEQNTGPGVDPGGARPQRENTDEPSSFTKGPVLRLPEY